VLEIILCKYDEIAPPAFLQPNSWKPTMVDASIQAELNDTLGQLPIALQHQVLEFARTLVVPRGVPGASLLKFAGVINDSDLDAMSRAIEEGCEGVDSNEW
jgi:hypothetical protein